MPAICQSPKSLRATTAELDDLRAPLLGCTDQILRPESAFCCLLAVGRGGHRSLSVTPDSLARHLQRSPEKPPARVIAKEGAK